MVFRGCFGEDTGNVTVPPAEGGFVMPRSRRNLSMRILRTPHNSVPDFSPTFTPQWGRVGITPNGVLVDLGAASDEAISALDKIGVRGAVVLGAGAGLVFSTNRLVGGLVGAGLGYLAGKYLAGIIKATVAVEKVATTVAKAT